MADSAPKLIDETFSSDIEYGRQGVTDIPIPLVASAQAFTEEATLDWLGAGDLTRDQLIDLRDWPERIGLLRRDHLHAQQR